MPAKKNQEQLSKRDMEVLELLKTKGINNKQLKELLNPSISIDNVKEYTLGDMNRVGVVSDTHLGDRECKLTELKQMYHILHEEGAKVVLHAGDVTAGVEIYGAKQHADLALHTVEDQINFVRDEYPDDLKTIFICGNHDVEGLARKAGLNIGRLIHDLREDMEFIGDYRGLINIDGVKIQLQHGDGGVAYAMSYKLQKYIENLASNRKPHIFILGHYHTAIQACIRDIFSMTGGAWQGETPFTIRKGLPPTVGGWLVDFTHKKRRNRKAQLTSFTPTFYSFNDPCE